mmetsp:Transcript_29161/g.72000  ORF Transcript_29161/g.72000 Transcript_29161/m.72000 type:complete len:329 (-) Transcript_29161:144-1130(-)
MIPILRRQQIHDALSLILPKKVIDDHDPPSVPPYPLLLLRQTPRVHHRPVQLQIQRARARLRIPLRVRQNLHWVPEPPHFVVLSDCGHAHVADLLFIRCVVDEDGHQGTDVTFVEQCHDRASQLLILLAPQQDHPRSQQLLILGRALVHHLDPMPVHACPHGRLQAVLRAVPDPHVLQVLDAADHLCQEVHLVLLHADQQHVVDRAVALEVGLDDPVRGGRGIVSRQLVQHGVEAGVVLGNGSEDVVIGRHAGEARPVRGSGALSTWPPSASQGEGARGRGRPARTGGDCGRRAEAGRLEYEGAGAQEGPRRPYTDSLRTKSSEGPAT